MQKRVIGLTICGIIFILAGLYTILWPLINLKAVSLLVPLAEYMPLAKFSPLIMGVLLGASGLICIVIGIGVLRLRFWAWYLIIINELIRIISLPNPGFIFGWQAINLSSLAIEIALIVFILWFFLRPDIKEQFGIAREKVNLKNSALPALLLIIALAIPVTVFGYKLIAIKRNQPFFTKKPDLIKILDVKKESSEKKFRKRDIFNLSFLVPENFFLRGFRKTGIIALGDAATDKSLIMVESNSSLEIAHVVYKIMKFKNAYQFEESLYSNNWGMILLVLRETGMSSYGDDPQVRRFETETVKGFLKYGYSKKNGKWVYDCSVYDKFNRGIGNIVFILKGNDFSQEEVFKIIASIDASRKEPAENFYPKGMQLLADGDVAGAQFALANAYYYMPKNAEYGYMLADSLKLNQNDKFSLNTAKKIIGEVLELRPDYTEAKQLLDSLPK